MLSQGEHGSMFHSIRLFLCFLFTGKKKRNFAKVQRVDEEYDMLPNRLSDLEREKPYARYQVELRQPDGTWAGSIIYACPVERFRLLLSRAGLKENERLRRVNTEHADMAMVTDTIITTIRP